jgi:hypothetical protein
MSETMQTAKNNEIEQNVQPVIFSLQLPVNQVEFILNALGDLPTKSGAWIVNQNIQQQVQKQLPTQEDKS